DGSAGKTQKFSRSMHLDDAVTGVFPAAVDAQNAHVSAVYRGTVQDIQAKSTRGAPKTNPESTTPAAARVLDFAFSAKSSIRGRRGRHLPDSQKPLVGRFIEYFPQYGNENTGGLVEKFHVRSSARRVSTKGDSLT